MPSASTSTLSSPSASRSSLSHWITLRSGIAAFSTGTSCDSGPREITKPPDVLRQVAREADQHVDQRDEQPRSPGCRDRSPASRRRLRSAPRLSHHASDLARRSTCASSRPSALPTSRTALLRPVGDDGGRNRGAVAAVFLVDVLDHFLAALVLEIHVDVGRLVALARDEAFGQHLEPVRSYGRDAQRVAHDRIGRRAPALVQISFLRARTGRCRRR